METVLLKITRDKAWAAAALPYRIFINNEQRAMLRIGKRIELEVPKERFAIRVEAVGNKLQFQRIESEKVIFPAYCENGVIECRVSSSLQAVGYLTLGLIKPMVTIKIDVIYK